MTTAALMTAGRAAYGISLIVAPATVIAVGTESPPGKPVCRVARILGVRHLAQALTSAWACRPDSSGRRSALTVGAAVDGLHAVSMLVLACTHPRLRRAGIADAAIATTLAGMGTASSLTSP